MNVYIGGAKRDYSAMRGPCDEGFHIPTVDNWNNLKAIYNAIVPSGNRDLAQHLKFASSKGITNTSSSASISYPTKITIGIRSGTFECWLCEQSSIKIARVGRSSMSSLQDVGSSNKSKLLEIRPFKDTEVIPDSTWTALYQGEGNAGIYHNSSLGLISLSSDGYTWLTISDKNLGATSIGDNGNMYQWGNNYGFTFSSGEYSSGFGTDFVDAESYGPLNYYSNSLPVFRSDSNGDVFYYWDSSNNSNLRGGETGVVIVPAELKNAYIGEYVPDFATRGPAPKGFHVPLQTEWQGLKTIMSGLGLTLGSDWRTNLHIPFAGSRSRISAEAGYQGTVGSYWSSSPYASNNYSAHSLNLGGSSNDTSSPVYRSACFSVRCFKNSFKIPTSSWTVINGTLGSAGIFWNQTDGLISITSDGTTGYTIQDKNLGATTVYNNGDTLTANNCGYFYQWGNNYGFPWTGSVATSSTTVNASTYGPGNYYSSGTFITRSSNPYDWSNPSNANLRGGVDGNVPVE